MGDTGMADMTREDHRKALEKYRDGILSGGISVPHDELLTALDAAITALRGWTYTADKPPDISKGDFDVIVVYPEKTHSSLHRYGLRKASDIIANPYWFLAWMPAPALPKEAN